MSCSRLSLRVPRLPRPVRWVLAGAVALAIVAASVADPSRVGDADGVTFLSDKHLHVIGYGAFAIVLAYATLHLPRRRRRLLFVLGAPLVLGAGLEVAQSTLPYRTASGADLAANALGAVVGSLWLALESRIEYAPLDVSGDE